MRETLADFGLLGGVMIAVIMIIVLFYNGCTRGQAVNPSAKVNCPVPMASTQIDRIHLSAPKVIDWRKLPLERAR